jgi:hypothetical protein
LTPWRLRDLAHHDDLAAALDRFEYVERRMDRLGRRLVVILQEVDAVVEPHELESPKRRFERGGDGG